MNATELLVVILSIIGVIIGGFTVVSSLFVLRKLPADVDHAVKRVAQAKPADIQQIAASQLELNNAYYKGVLQQSRLSFFIATLFAAAGLGFFFLVAKSPANPSFTSITGGTLTELLSALNFYLYGRASNQLETFHSRLDKLQFFVLANSICENLNEELKYETRSELVLAVASFITVKNTETTLRSKNRRNLQEKVTTIKEQTNHKEAQEKV
jgi:cytochrome c biogenesis protein CcdA